MFIDGQPFVVRENIWNFLFRAKEEDKIGSLWIDATCIDQSCAAERNHQVGIMGSIYSKATKVIVWLGAGPLELDAAVRDLP